MLLPLAAGILASALLLFVSAFASPEWRTRRAAGADAILPPTMNGVPVFFALGAFGVAVGVPAALGFVEANVLVVPAGLVATVVARRLLSSGDPSYSAGPNASPVAAGQVPSRDALVWLVILGWSILAAAWTAGSFEVRGALAAQAVLGPAALWQGSWLSVIACLGFLAGLVSAVFWAGATPSIATAAGARAEAWLRWGEAALAGAAISAAYFGPAPGGLSGGPAASDLRTGMAASYALTCMVVAAISWSRRSSSPAPGRATQLVWAGVALAALGAGALGR